MGRSTWRESVWPPRQAHQLPRGGDILALAGRAGRAVRGSGACPAGGYPCRLAPALRIFPRLANVRRRSGIVFDRVASLIRRASPEEVFMLVPISRRAVFRGLLALAALLPVVACESARPAPSDSG